MNFSCRSNIPFHCIARLIAVDFSTKELQNLVTWVQWEAPGVVSTVYSAVEIRRAAQNKLIINTAQSEE